MSIERAGKTCKTRRFFCAPAAFLQEKLHTPPARSNRCPVPISPVPAYGGANAPTSRRKRAQAQGHTAPGNRSKVTKEGVPPNEETGHRLRVGAGRETASAGRERGAVPAAAPVCSASTPGGRGAASAGREGNCRGKGAGFRINGKGAAGSGIKIPDGATGHGINLLYCVRPAARLRVCTQRAARQRAARATGGPEKPMGEGR